MAARGQAAAAGWWIVGKSLLRPHVEREAEAEGEVEEEGEAEGEGQGEELER